jgi:ACS family tartrate transporter-like MFS transporter
MPSQFLTGVGAAAGIALINSIGSVGGYAGPLVVGWIKDTSHSFEAGLYFLAACAFASAVLAFFGTRATATTALGVLRTPARQIRNATSSYDAD